MGTIFRVRGVIAKLSMDTDSPDSGNGNGTSAAMGGVPIRRATTILNRIQVHQ
jgi:hypothetical protein